MTIERILIFIRNVLQVPANDNEKRAGNEATVHDEVNYYINIKVNFEFSIYYILNVILSKNIFL